MTTQNGIIDPASSTDTNRVSSRIELLARMLADAKTHTSDQMLAAIAGITASICSPSVPLVEQVSELSAAEPLLNRAYRDAKIRGDNVLQYGLAAVLEIYRAVGNQLRSCLAIQQRAELLTAADVKFLAALNQPGNHSCELGPLIDAAGLNLETGLLTVKRLVGLDLVLNYLGGVTSTPEGDAVWKLRGER